MGLFHEESLVRKIVSWTPTPSKLRWTPHPQQAKVDPHLQQTTVELHPQQAAVDPHPQQALLWMWQFDSKNFIAESQPQDSPLANGNNFRRFFLEFYETTRQLRLAISYLKQLGHVFLSQSCSNIANVKAKVECL
ncbi:hypothetical protein ElyMa_006315700 [Elysia marginata]|uniref:Uncharacterized protein n=1 Tax=Elysia marginata TaxID=1093978 RepID=A0AAV4HHM1_9GAST|nr:hypothetical protein ElyMa_006315700 [Elysia marginata]